MNTRLRKSLIASLVVAATTGSVLASEPAYYIEGNFGKTNISNVDTETYSGSISGYTWNAKANIEYNSPATYGFEIGANKPGGLPLRTSFAFNTMKGKFQKAAVTGTISDAVDTYSSSEPITRADTAALGLNFDNRINLYSINAYYDFDTKSALRPYLGIGLGLADIENVEDTEFFYSLHAGLNYDITKTVYVGARVGWYRISGPTDKVGIAYEDVKATNFSITLGYRF